MKIMKSNDLYKAFELIDKNRSDFDGEKSEELIKKAEKALNLSFPPSYRNFLKVLGCGNIMGLEFYGLTNDNFVNSAIPNAIWLTLDERRLGLPNHLVLIYGVGDGSYYAIDTNTKFVGNENPIVHYSFGEITCRIADNFGSFLLEELQTVL